LVTHFVANNPSISYLVFMRADITIKKLETSHNNFVSSFSFGFNASNYNLSILFVA
jgi:hypothetical protein